MTARQTIEGAEQVKPPVVNGETVQAASFSLPAADISTIVTADYSTAQQVTPSEGTSAPMVPQTETAPATIPVERTSPLPADVSRDNMTPPKAEPVVTAGEYVREIVISEPVARSETPPVAPPSETSPLPLQFDWSSDLIQIETHPDKYKAALARSAETPPPIRVRRERPKLPPMNDEPLVQVETRKTESSASPEILQTSPVTSEQTAVITAN